MKAKEKKKFKKHPFTSKLKIFILLSRFFDFNCVCVNSFLRLNFLSVPLLLHSMGQIIRSLASVCLCVCHRSYGRNFE